MNELKTNTMKRKLLSFLVSIILCGSSVYAQSNHWNPGQFNMPANCNIWWSATLDGEALTSNDIEVAAFVDGECRASARLTYLNNTVGQMQVPHSGVVVVTFKMYDHATETEYEDCSTVITTSAEEEVLGLVNQNLVPVVFAFTSPSSFGPAYPWIAPMGVYPSNMSVTAEIQINGVPVTEADRWELGAFCGDECRGDQQGLGVGPFGLIMYLTVYGNADDVLNFYLYDLDNDEVFLGVCPTTVVYVPQGGVGEVWDPFILNFVTAQTFTKDIIGYGDGDNYWYFIASPVNEPVTPSATNGFLTDEFDLFYFDQAYLTEEWRNYEVENFVIENGKGYLYASQENTTLTFTGTPFTGDDGYAEVELVYDETEGHEWYGWNLVGNPFANDANVDRPFYRLDPETGEYLECTEDDVVPMMEGIFVQTFGEENEMMSFCVATGGIGGGGGQTKLVINVNQGRGVSDRAIVRFDGKSTLSKLQFKSNSTQVYIPVEGKDYAVVNAPEMGEIPVNFKAGNNGTYTMSFSNENVEFNYLHLIDNMTGADVDLLVNPSYSFEANTTDYASRFKLVFATGANDENFAFFSNGGFVISNEGEATLQVIDVTGRILSSESISGSANVHVSAAPGVYMLRLINGDNMKVQKVVVK